MDLERINLGDYDPALGTPTVVGSAIEAFDWEGYDRVPAARPGVAPTPIEADVLSRFALETNQMLRLGLTPEAMEPFLKALAEALCNQEGSDIRFNLADVIEHVRKSLADIAVTDRGRSQFMTPQVVINRADMVRCALVRAVREHRRETGQVCTTCDGSRWAWIETTDAVVACPDCRGGIR